MKIALLGYGTMGQTIDKMASAKGHEVCLRIDANNRSSLTIEELQTADVVIEFSRPEAALDNILLAIEAGVPIVSGTTGWLDHLEAVKEKLHASEGAFLYASNFSIGVNIFFALNRYLAELMNRAPQYDVALHEIHHIRKLDAPSGTAITLAEDAIAKLDRKQDWAYQDSLNPDQLYVSASRIADTPGTHQINYRSDIDQIKIEHQAFNRRGFAEGAVLAAEWIIGKKGYFNMQDVLGI